MKGACTETLLYLYWGTVLLVPYLNTTHTYSTGRGITDNTVFPLVFLLVTFPRGMIHIFYITQHAVVSMEPMQINRSHYLKSTCYGYSHVLSKI